VSSHRGTLPFVSISFIKSLLILFNVKSNFSMSNICVSIEKGLLSILINKNVHFVEGKVQ
jgi:hypothetical protein